MDEKLEAHGVKLLKVSCCRECNSLLSDRNILHLSKRVRFVYDKLLKRYYKILHSPRWDDEDLDELGPNLRSALDSHCSIKEWAERRLSMMEDIHEDWI